MSRRWLGGLALAAVLIALLVLRGATGSASDRTTTVFVASSRVEAGAPALSKEAAATPTVTWQARPPVTSTPDGAASASSDGGLELAALVQSWREENQARAAKNVERFCVEAAGYERFPRYEEPTRSADAARFMLGRPDLLLPDGVKSGTLNLPPTVSSKPLRELSPEDYRNLDFGWMHALLGYDSWSLDGLLGDNPDADVQLYMFLDWVRLRLAKGLEEHELEQASLEARHLADLIASTGQARSSSLRLKMLIVVREAFERAGQPVPGDLPEPGEAYFRGTFPSFGSLLLAPGVSTEVKARALRCASPAERCEMVAEAVREAVVLREVDPRFGEEVAWLEAQSVCAPSFLSVLASQRGTPREQLVQRYHGNEPLMRMGGAFDEFKAKLGR